MTKLLSFFVIIFVVLIGIYTFKLAPNAGVSDIPIKDTDEALTTFDFQKWHEFGAPNGKFKVMLPTLPQHATDNIKDKNTGENRKYEMYVSQKSDGSVFMISVINFLKPPATKDKDVLLRTMMNDVVESNPNNTLLKVESSKYKGFDALDYSIENTEMHIDAKTFITGDTLFVLTRVAKKAHHSMKEFDFFINSFDLTSQNSTSKLNERTK